MVQSDAINALSQDARENFLPTMIAAAGNFIGGLVYRWRERERWQNRHPRFVFEDGDRDKGSLMTAMKTLTGQAPSFEHKKDDPSKGIVAFTPLQAADILAYEVKKIADQLGKPLPLDFRFRFPYQQLDRIQGEPMVFNMDSVKATESIININQYFEENPLGGKPEKNP